MPCVRCSAHLTLAVAHYWGASSRGRPPVPSAEWVCPPDPRSGYFAPENPRFALGFRASSAIVYARRMRIPQMFRGLLGSLLATLVSVAGCDEQQGAVCKSSFDSAQRMVNQIDSTSIESVEKSLTSVNAAIAA